jgi:RNA polymerase sigma-70 factor (ECF subfamily)
MALTAGPSPSTGRHDGLVRVLAEEDAAEVRAALANLSPRYQRAIDLRYLAGLDQADAARAMGLAKPAFAVVLSRALKSLRRELTTRGAASTGEGVDQR